MEPMDVDTVHGDLPQLPLEMVETVIDHLHKDVKSLKSCSLVCKAWLKPSRYHIFSTHSHIQMTERKLGPFLQLLRCQKSSFPAFFHTLCFMKSEAFSLNLSDLLTAAQALLTIRSLVVSMNSATWPLAARIEVASRLNQVVNLELKLTAVMPSPQSHLDYTFAFAASFPNLQLLKLSGTCFPDPENKPSNIRFPASLNTIHLYLVGSLQGILPYLKKHPTLSNLHVYNISPRDVEGLQAYLDKPCTVLESLTYDFSRPQLPLLNLSALLSLRYLSLSAPYDQPVTWLCQALQTVASLELRQVRLVLYGYTPPSANEPWEALDKMLCGFTAVNILTGLKHALFVNKRLVECKRRGNLGMKVWQPIIAG
ncbi:hypothetical protein C8J56DRAFT_932682 [Mycena floridula]|nr:hypothetical protein C8J56DRAFT_932682 [Mycena floridula]